MKKLGLLILVIMLGALPALAQYVAQDPTRYIPNARVLGLGKAYVGLANDAGSIYTNPAGLAEVTGWQFSSMSGKFLDEYSYLSASGLYPTPYGTIGIGFAGTSIGGAYATTVEADSDPDDPIYTIDTSQPQMGNSSNAIVLSYGNQAANLPYIMKVPFADRIALGANLKLFRASLSGDSIVGGDASGTELDLGLKFTPPQKWLKIGLAMQNVLPAAMGGKLKYTSGHEESYPAVIETGAALSILGKEDALLKLGDHEVRLMADFDYHPTLSGYPMVWHVGAEWRPIGLVALRAGLDQDAAGDGAGNLGVVSDPTYGVGLYWGGFAFDYAYHTFGGAPNIDNHFFSLSYAFQPPAVASIKEPILVISPADKLITFESNAPVTGIVADTRIRTLLVKGVPLKFDLKGNFSTTAELKIGKNAVVIEGKDDKNGIMGSTKRRILRLMTFPDVPLVYWVRQPISLLAMTNIITGYPDGTFRPEGNITRAEICSLLMKAKGASTGVQLTAKFTDVVATHWAANYIGQAAAGGVVKGYPGNVFKPNGKITRAEGLAMVARFAGISEEVYARQFPDIDASQWSATIIAGASKAGLLEYLKNKNFEPNRQLTRSETVELLQRTEYVRRLLEKDILNWESY